MMTNINDIKAVILDTFEESGLFINDMAQIGDFSLLDFLANSLQFITIIVSLEDKLNISYPDDMLNMDRLSSFSSFCENTLLLVQEAQAENTDKEIV